MDLLKKLLYFALIAFPLGAVIRIKIVESVYIYPLDAAVGFIFLNILFIAIKSKKNIFKIPNFKALLYFAFFAFIGLLINPFHLPFMELLISFLYLGRFLIYSSLLSVFVFFPLKFSSKYLFLLSLSGFVFVVLGLLQYLYYPDLRNLYYLGWDEHLYRLFSTVLDPNFAGSILVLDLLLLLGLYQSKNNRAEWFKKLYLAGIFVALLSIFLTYSRSTFVMLLSSGIIYLFITRQKNKIIILLLIIITGIIILPKSFKSEGVDLLRTASITSRTQSYVNALNIYKISPFLGTGFDSYRYVQQKLGLLDQKNWQSTHSAAGVPNSLIFVMVTTGILGFVFYINLWARFLKNVYYKVYGNNKLFYLYSAVFSSIIGIFIHSIFENTLFYPFIMFWIFILLSFIGCR